MEEQYEVYVLGGGWNFRQCGPDTVNLERDLGEMRDVFGGEHSKKLEGPEVGACQ